MTPGSAWNLDQLALPREEGRVRIDHHLRPRRSSRRDPVLRPAGGRIGAVAAPTGGVAADRAASAARLMARLDQSACDRFFDADPSRRYLPGNREGVIMLREVDAGLTSKGSVSIGTNAAR